MWNSHKMLHLAIGPPTHGSDTTTAEIGCTNGELIISAARADACELGTVYGCSSVIWIGPGAYATEGAPTERRA